ncbi:helix-turn-helix domain-containing protein [Methylomonas sp. CM2]
MPLNLKAVREAAETVAINRALSYTDHNVSEAAKLLGVTRPTLYGLFEKYGIPISARNQSDD